MRIRLDILLVTLLVLASPAATADLPAPLDMTYRGKLGGLGVGTLEKHLRREADGSYQVYGETKAKGIAAILLRDTYDEESRFRVDGDMIYPDNYRLGPRSEPDKQRVAEFDWNAKLVRLNNDRQYPLEPGIQDAASFPFWWMLKPPLDHDSGNISIVDGKRLSTFRYEVKGIQVLESVFGETPCLVVERRKPGEEKKIFRMWFAVDHHYVPILLESIRPNYTLTFELTEIRGLPEAAAPR